MDTLKIKLGETIRRTNCKLRWINRATFCHDISFVFAIMLFNTRNLTHTFRLWDNIFNFCQIYCVTVKYNESVFFDPLSNHLCYFEFFVNDAHPIAHT